MAKVVCLECEKTLVQNIESEEKAQHLATLHTRFTPHLMCFGFSDEKAPKFPLAPASGVFPKWAK